MPDQADLEEVELTRGEREHLAWLLSRAIGHGQVTLREVWGGIVRVSMNAVISASAPKAEEDVVMELRPGTLGREPRTSLAGTGLVGQIGAAAVLGLMLGAMAWLVR